MLKNKKLTQKEICDKWLQDKNINPETKRKITENGEVYKKLSKKCSLNQKPKKDAKLTQKEICDKWLKDKNINPETSRKIKENGEIYKKLSKLCSLNQKVKSISSSMSFKSLENLESQKVKSSASLSTKINAIKKIHKLFIPYIKRTSVNIIDRVNYFTIIKRYLLSIKETKNCVRLYNIDAKTQQPIYRVGTSIILDKQIGSPSAYGIVFLSHFKSNMKYGTKFDKLNKFAVKITNQTKENKKEIKILEQLTKEVIELKCPHFPISYGSLRCNNSRAKSDNPDDYSIVNDKHNKKKLFPKLVNKNKSLLIQINELAFKGTGTQTALNFPTLAYLSQVIGNSFYGFATAINYNNSSVNIIGFDLYTKNNGYSGNILTALPLSDKILSEKIICKSLLDHDPVFNYLYLKLVTKHFILMDKSKQKIFQKIVIASNCNITIRFIKVRLICVNIIFIINQSPQKCMS